LLKFVVIPTAFLAMPGAALAAEADDGNGTSIIVTGKAGGYQASDSHSATRTATPLLDVPQAITVITRKQLDDQAPRSMAEVLRYVPGTTVGQGEGNRDQVTLRGQNTSADFFLDGLRDDVQYFRTLYNIERVEVLKGPLALIFGRGGSGGVINRVQKTPSLEARPPAMTASINSFGSWDISADINLPLGGGAAFRLNGDSEKLANHRDYFEGKRTAINPFLALELGGGWKAGLSYEYVHDNRVADRGVPSIATGANAPNRPLAGYRNRFFGVPGINRAWVEAHIFQARLEGKLAGDLTWTSTVLYGDYDKFYANVFANDAATSQTGLVALASYINATKRQNWIAQTNLVWPVNQGAISNRILMGLEYGDQDSRGQRRNGTLSNAWLNLARFDYPSVTYGELVRDALSNVRFLSAYAQDQIKIGPHWELVIGLRYDRFTITGSDRSVSLSAFSRTDEELSPRIGLIFKPQKNVSVYGSYSRSFLPRSGDQFVTLTATQANLAPEKFTNLEVGGKWDIRRGLNLSLALFRLDRTNATTPDPGNIAATINVGTTRTTGLELALSGQITPEWQLSGGYTHQDAKLRGNALVRLAQVPQHQFALWNRYDFDHQLGLGLGMVHQASQFAAIRTVATTTRLPAYTRLDAALYFKAGDRLELQANIENLLNQDYFSDAHSNNNITPGAPLNVRLTTKIKL